jgi:N-methylhydantoinase B
VNVASNIPIEEAECAYPVRIERYGLAADSGGAGRYRGGLAVEREWHLLQGKANLSIRSDRRDHPPYGLYGGAPGLGSVNLLYRDGVEEVLPTFVSTIFAAGERLYHRMPGGGGWGDPLERNPDAVAWDVKNEKVSLEAARDLYGVVFHANGFVDIEATAGLRDAMRDARGRRERR